jgi:hypothetical protein
VGVGQPVRGESLDDENRGVTVADHGADAIFAAEAGDLGYDRRRVERRTIFEMVDRIARLRAPHSISVAEAITEKSRREGVAGAEATL